MLRASGVAAELDAEALPWLPGTRELLNDGVRSTFHAQNESAVASLLDTATDPATSALLVDPQTSGGLLFAVSAAHAEPALRALHEAGDTTAASIGTITAAPPTIFVRGASSSSHGRLCPGNSC
jgi:selenide,water dikinase